MIEPISYGWKCPCCGRVYSPTQPMCLYCGQEEKQSFPIEEITTPFIVGPTNINEINGTKSSPYYTTTGIISYEEKDSPSVTLYAENSKSQFQCSNYKNGICLGVKEPFESDCQGILDKCTEYNNEKR